MPLCFFLDIVTPFFTSENFLDLIREGGPRRLLIDTVLFEEHAVLNKNVPFVVASIMVTTCISNIIEVIMFLYYREKISRNYLSVVIHHILLIFGLWTMFDSGSYILAYQAWICLHHTSYFPMCIATAWKKKFSFVKKWNSLFQIWVLAWYTFTSIFHVQFLKGIWLEGASPVEYIGKPFALFLSCFILFLFYYDINVMKRAVASLTAKY